ncbi:MAG TPA: hypothetical protein VGL49_00920, partial [Acidimicrobiales bacterium]
MEQEIEGPLEDGRTHRVGHRSILPGGPSGPAAYHDRVSTVASGRRVSSGSTAPSGDRVFSGIKPTGDPHLGNLLGAVRWWVEDQRQGDSFFCVV